MTGAGPGDRGGDSTSVDNTGVQELVFKREKKGKTVNLRGRTTEHLGCDKIGKGM